MRIYVGSTSSGKKGDAYSIGLQKWNLMGSGPFSRLKAEQQVRLPGWRKCDMSIGTIILIILVIALLGGFSGIGGGPFYGTGYYGGGGLGLVIVILLILLLLGRL
jgi:Protein of unknown function (DUF3309)